MDFENQPNWRSDVANVKMASDKRNWTEMLKTSSMMIRFRMLEETPPSKLVLQTGADDSFEGRYVAEFRQKDGGTVAIFTEEAAALGVLPKGMRRLFFKGQKEIH